MSINIVVIAGNITREPELRYLPKGTAIVEVSIAVNKNWTTDSGEKLESVAFVDVTIWGKQAEAFAKYLAKGRPVLIEGELQQDQWDDKETGKKRSKLFVRCSAWHFIDSKKSEGGSRSDAPAGQPEQDDVPY